MVEFVSYDGKYPCLCFGKLVVNIDGKEVSFGYSSGCDYTKFWYSGGNCGFNHDYSESYVNSGPWIVDEDDLPEEYKSYAKELMYVLNDNVEFGCCGGCL